MAKPHLLMIGGWTETLAKALDAGFELSYLGACTASDSFDPRLLKKCYVVRETRIDQIGLCLSIARELQADKPIDAVISFTELGMETAAVIADALKIRGLDLRAVSQTRYKDQMRRVLADDPEMSIPWKRLEKKQDLLCFYDMHGPAIIIKPVSGAASVGVQQIKSREALCAVCDELDSSTIDGLMAEKLIDSDRLYSVETLTIEGVHTVIALSMSQMVGHPHALQSYTVVPPRDLNNETRDRIAVLVKRFLGNIGLVDGVAHTEVKLGSNNRPYIIESQTRVGGDRIWRMVELTTKIDQIGLTLRNLGAPVSIPILPATESVAAFLYLLPPSGHVKAVCDFGFLDRNECVLDHSNSIKPGETLDPVTNATERRGHILLHARNHEELFSRANDLYRHIWVEYDNGTVWHPKLD